MYYMLPPVIYDNVVLQLCKIKDSILILKNGNAVFVCSTYIVFPTSISVVGILVLIVMVTLILLVLVIILKKRKRKKMIVTVDLKYAEVSENRKVCPINFIELIVMLNV